MNVIECMYVLKYKKQTERVASCHQTFMYVPICKYGNLLAIYILRSLDDFYKKLIFM
jgi:hypothetical protein